MRLAESHLVEYKKKLRLISGAVPTIFPRPVPKRSSMDAVPEPTKKRIAFEKRERRRVGINV